MENKKELNWLTKNLKSIVIVVVVVLVGLILLAFSSGKDSTEVSNTDNKKPSVEVTEKYSRGSFIAECSEDGTNSQKECTCIYEVLIGHYGDINKIPDNYTETDDITDGVFNRVISCLDFDPEESAVIDDLFDF